MPAPFVRNPKSINGGHGVENGDRPYMKAAAERGYHEKEDGNAVTNDAKQWQGWGSALKPALEPICFARKPFKGTLARNVLAHGTGALNIDACRIDAERPTGWGGQAGGGRTWNTDNCGLGKDGDARPVQGRWPANVVHDGSEEVVTAFPASSGQQSHTGAAFGDKDSRGIYGDYGPRPDAMPRGDKGSAARFFYSAKADGRDRLGSDHPTVKPIDLMRWLLRLITPPGGIALDPFAGTGTTGIAAIGEGFGAILIEREARFVADIQHRFEHAVGLHGHSGALMARNKHAPEDPLPLFGNADDKEERADACDDT